MVKNLDTCPDAIKGAAFSIELSAKLTPVSLFPFYLYVTFSPTGCLYIIEVSHFLLSQGERLYLMEIPIRLPLEADALSKLQNKTFEEPVQESEAAVITQALTNPEYFAVIYERYALRIFRYCLRKTGDVEEAEDLTSLIFIQALDKLAAYQGGSVAAWLFQIAHNMSVNFLKKASRQRQHSGLPLVVVEAEEYLYQHSDETLEQLIILENHERLAHLVTALSDEQRELLALKFAGGLSAREIGTVLHKSETTIRVALHRIIQKLRREYQESGQE